jgi:hypothetical protein
MLFNKRESRKELLSRIDKAETDAFLSRQNAVAAWTETYESKEIARAEKQRLLTDIDRLLSENQRLSHELINIKCKEAQNNPN